MTGQSIEPTLKISTYKRHNHNMRKVFFLLLLISMPLFAEKPPVLSYKIKNLGEHRIAVELSFTGSASGTTVIKLPDDWGDRKDLYKNISHLSVEGENHLTIQDDTTPDKKLIFHAPSESLKLSYELRQGFIGKPKTLENIFEAVIQNDYIYFLGRNALILPELKHDDITVNFQWDVPHSWNIANSFGMQQHTQIQINITKKELLDAMFMLGKMSLSVEALDNTSLWMAVVEAFPGLDLKQFLVDTKKIMAYQMAFWESNQEHLLIGIVPINEEDDSYLGMGSTNAFLLALPTNIKSDSKFGMLLFAAHELFHIWNDPRLLNLEGMRYEPEIYWLTEGFTDYYALQSLLKSRTITLKDYIDEYNDVLLSYYTSPTKNVRNTVIGKYYWGDYSYIRDLPYQRGMILAHNWNARIKAASKGKYSLDDLMKEIFPQHSDKKRTLDDIKQLSKTYLPGGISKDIKRYIETGKLIEPDPESFGSCAKLVIEEKSVEGKLIKVPQFEITKKTCTSSTL